MDRYSVKWHRDGKTDPRCDEIVLNPTGYLCKKWDIPMGEDIADAAIHLYYRFIPGPRDKNIQEPCGVLIDDFPEAYHPRHKIFIDQLKTYDFFVTPNPLIQLYLQLLIGHKKTLFYNGLCAKTYYSDKGVLNKRIFHSEKRMAFIFQGGYTFNIDKYCHPGWKLLYFSNDVLHKNSSIIRKPYMSIFDYYRTVSEFSPDIIVQGWIDHPFFKFKANLKFRESVTFESCLVAQDKEHIYHIDDGVNGFIWQDINKFHEILEQTPIEKFRMIGKSHQDNDREVLSNFYEQLIDLRNNK